MEGPGQRGILEGGRGRARGGSGTVRDHRQVNLEPAEGDETDGGRGGEGYWMLGFGTA